MSEFQPVVLPPDAPYVNALLLQAIRGIEEVMGANGLNAMLRASGLERFVDAPPPNNLEADVLVREYARLNEAIETFTGRAGKGMLRRIGRASFRWAAQEQQATMGLAGIALKVLPHRLRKKAILLAIRKGLTDTIDYAQVHVGEEENTLIYTDYTCTICHQRHGDEAVCHLYVGTLGEAMSFATGRDFDDFIIEETHCKAKGDGFCRFTIRDRS